GVRQWRRARLVGMDDLGTRGWNLTVCAAGELFSFRTKFLIDATGRASALACKLGARRLVHDHLIGAARYFAARPSQAMAAGYTLIEAVEDGWWYAAALPGAGMVAVLMTDADVYARGSRSATGFWQDRLNHSRHLRSMLKSSTPLAGTRVVAA